ncbi:accessory Sec system protein Asp3 [Streptococcus suis]|nr:accessory Sec system protein Asp3 [Streptococcus suis]
MSDHSIINVIIPWGHLNRSSYLYGTSLNYLESGRVQFQQKLLPIAAVIHSWTSLTNYQADRDIPHLPLLKRGKTYYLSLHFIGEPQHIPFMKVRLLDRAGKELSQTVIKGGKGSFDFIEGAYSYIIELINVGCEEFVFDYLHLSELEEILDEDHYPVFVDKVVIDQSTDPLFVLFQEPSIGCQTTVPTSIKSVLREVIGFHSIHPSTHAYRESETEAFISSMLASYRNRHMIFVGCGVESNKAAIYYSKEFLISEVYLAKESEGDSFGIDEWHPYHVYTVHQGPNPLVSPILDKSHYLDDLVIDLYKKGVLES